MTIGYKSTTNQQTLQTCARLPKNYKTVLFSISVLRNMLFKHKSFVIFIAVLRYNEPDESSIGISVAALT